MKRILKWAGIALAALAAVLAIVIFYLSSSAEKRMNKHYEIAAEEITLPSDSAALETGRKWVEVLCAHCHGENLAGTKFFHEPDLATFYTPNLTTGKGGIGKDYSVGDWVRAIRHGARKDGKALIIMPAQDFNLLSREDLGALIAYLKTIPAVDQEWPASTTTMKGRVLVQLGAFGNVLNVETIDHKAPFTQAPPRSENPDYGDYLVKVFGCRTCHGAQLSGGHDPNPAAPPAPNLTPGGNLKRWGVEGYLKFMHTGITPDGKEVNTDFMPWKNIGKFEDDQLKAIYNYLMSQPELPTTVK